MDITDVELSLEQLRCLIGVKVEHNGTCCEIIEILEDGPTLILQECELHPVIQADQHGEAHRRVPSTQTVPILTADRSELSSAFLGLDLIES
jgi:hypothetical protein